jgi:hypothetical protein
MVFYIGLIVTGTDAYTDFTVFVKTLELWHTDVILYVGTDTTTESLINSLTSKLTIKTLVCMNYYTGKSRSDMEALPGIIYDSLFKDYTYEKATILEYLWEVENPQEVWFMDADIVHCGPLPVIPSNAILALSPHSIRTADEALYGKYNAGYFWLKDRTLLKKWKLAGHTSKFYEQTALESLALTVKHKLYEFPPQVNFGWWRMYQNKNPSTDIQNKFGINRTDQGIGIRYDGVALQSLHTHSRDNTYSTNGQFNKWFLKFIDKFVSKHKPLQIWKNIVYPEL